jgi:hypothetical protein
MSVAAGSMQAVTGEIEMAFPDWPRRKLKRVAEDHAADAALSRGHTPGDAPVERLVVNMLRHEFTSYDSSQSQEAHRVVCEAIAARFGWLRPECERQIQARARHEADDAGWIAAAREHEAARAAWRHDRVAESRDAIGQFTVGMRVTATVRGHRRDATVVKIGRSRVTVMFQIKSGAVRTAQLYARDVQPDFR